MNRLASAIPPFRVGASTTGMSQHNDHRDANAAFTLAQRVSPIGGVASESESRRSGLLVSPFLGTEAQQCA